MPSPSRPSKAQPGVMPDVGVRQENAVEGTALSGPAAEGRLVDQIELAGDVGRRIDEIVPFGGKGLTSAPPPTASARARK